MPTPWPVYITGAVEGDVDEAVLRRIAQHVGLELVAVYGKQGKAYLREKVGAYNNAARHGPWVVLADLDQDAACAPPMLLSWLPNPSAGMRLRFAVREVEAWLLGDQDRLARFLRVPPAHVPPKPESVLNPKVALVNLARSSRSAIIRDDLVPRPKGGRLVGPLYASRLIEFVADASFGWRPDVAARSCDSLSRCLDCLLSLAARTQG